MTSISDTNVVNAPGGLVELGYGEFSYAGNVTATSGSPLAVMSPLTVICDGSPILIDAYIAGIRPALTAGAFIIVELYEDGLLINSQWALVITPASGDRFSPASCHLRRTPSAGAHTYQVKTYVSGGTGYISSGDFGRSASFLRVSKIIQASQLIVQTPNAPLVTSLPSNAIDGQEVRYLADNTNGIIWNLRYRAGSSSAHKWEFIGGPSLTEISTASFTFTDNTISGAPNRAPTLTVPLAGDYDVSFWCYGYGLSTTARSINGSTYSSTGVGTTDAEGIVLSAVTSNMGQTGTSRKVHTLAVGTISLRFKVPSGLSSVIEQRGMTLTPIRVSA
jgi:hypothetical protein